MSIPFSDTRLGKLLEIKKRLETGPASFTSSPFDDLTKKQRARVKKDFDLWCGSWIIPVIDAEIARLRKRAA